MKLRQFLTFPWARRAVWSLGILLVIWGIAWLAVPPVLKRLLEDKASAALGRVVSIGAVDFRPWSLELTLANVAVATADGKGKQLSVERVYVDAELESLLRMAPVVDAITIDSPTLQLTHAGDGRYDIDDILARLQKSSGPAQPSGSTSAPKFAFYNLTVNQGAADFVDLHGSKARKHILRKLHVALPFLSNLESQRQVKVEPHLGFELNGSTFDSAAEGTPFAQTRKGDAQLKITHLDLAPYLPYLPTTLPVRLQSAVIDASIRLDFEQAQKARVALSGTLDVSDLKLAQPGGAELLAVQSIRAVMSDVRPLERVVKLTSVDITAPKLRAVRDRSGQLNWALLSQKPAEAARGDAPPSVPPNAPWSVELGRLAVQKAEVLWTDEGIEPLARLNVKDAEFVAKDVQWPMVKAATLEGSFKVPAGAGKSAKLARLQFSAEGTDQLGTAHATLTDAPLELGTPYLAQYLEPSVVGLAQAQLSASWQGKQVRLAVQSLAVRDAAFKMAKPAGAMEAMPTAGTRSLRVASALPQFKSLEVSDAQIDLSTQSVRVGKVLVNAPSTTVSRDAEGVWSFKRWLKPRPPTDSKPPWRVVLDDLQVVEGSVRLDDRFLPRPARVELSAFKLDAKAVALDGSSAATVSASTRVRSGRTEPGSLAYQGTVMWAPVAVQGSVQATDIPLHAVAPYLADKLNVDILRADTSFKGQVRYGATAQGAQVQVQGDAALTEFHANTLQPQREGMELSEDLLSWKSLQVPGIVLAIAPGTSTRLEVREAVLTDFFARIIVGESGRINLQDLVKAQPTDAAVAQVPAADAVPTAPSLPAMVKMGPISLINGKVLFSDRFIRPNYSANLTELNGKLSQFSSQASDQGVQMADVEVRGRAEGTASLELTGKINPLTKPMALDIKGRMRDLELPPLSTYAVKYAGYGIERGKLSMDVAYAIQPDGQLSASNKLVLNQLTFGDKVDGAPNSLPVKLAVALLADRNGVIDLDLPISGSLNDPQFRIGPVIWQVITNLIAKAVTAPFNLLARALGGGSGGEEELSTVRFAAGSSVLEPAAKQSLVKIAKALMDRPSLKLTVVGTANLEAERDALKRERLKGLLLAEKRRRLAGAGQSADAVDSLTDAEYPTLLKAVYRRADIAKPRNFVGLAKDLDNAQMETLLLSGIAINEDAVNDLALARAVAVQEYLVSQKLAADRLFLGATKIAKPEGDWKPQAELSVGGS